MLSIMLLKESNLSLKDLSLQLTPAILCQTTGSENLFII